MQKWKVHGATKMQDQFFHLRLKYAATLLTKRSLKLQTVTRARGTHTEQKNAVAKENKS